MIWHLLGHWLGFLLPTFYKRIQMHGEHHLYGKDPMVIAMNHPNAFTDPIAVSYHTYPLRLHYMARGDAFKPGPIAWLLGEIGIVPIFRIQDAGKEGLKRNDDAYRKVNRLLEKNGKVIVFAEGLCVQERRLRPLKKGVARMVFGAFEHLPHDRLKVVPVGVNYSKPDKFRSKLLYNVGPPISVKDYAAAYRENPARAYKTFLQDLEKAMLEQVVHIPRPELDDTVHYAEKLTLSEARPEAGRRDLYSEFRVSRSVIDRLLSAEKTQPEAFTRFRDDAAAYFGSLRSLRLKDWLFRPGRQKWNVPAVLLFRILVIAAVSPVYAAGMAMNFPPLVLTHLVTKKIVKAVEFYSSFALGVAMFLFPAFYAGWFSLFYAASHHVLLALAGCLAGGLSGWACLYVHPFILRTLGLGRFLALPPAERKKRIALRAALVGMLNKF